MKLRAMLPRIYWEILNPEFLALNPEEKLADCSNCFKTKSQAPKPHFSSQTKCCTYYPFLPNYLIGGILQDTSLPEPRRQIVKSRILSRQFMLPIGGSAPPVYQQKFRNKDPEDFGNRMDLLCDFYDSVKGGCSIWQWRGHECTTYFCHSSYGEKGENFWQRIRSLLFELEMYLSQMAMLHLGFINRDIDLNIRLMKGETETISWSLDAMNWSNVWAHQFEDIEKYYIKSYEYVREHAYDLNKEWNDNRASATADNLRVLNALLVGR